MLQYQQICISDHKNLQETRASIDTLTSFLKKDVLNLVQPKTLEEARPGYELLPSYQLSRKIEYTSGKAGIAPFALNSTNHALTQFVHLSVVYSHNNKYNLGSLDAIYGEDGFRILDWLSAMINAHVDVAKDPYIITLNVNAITYNMANLLLRGGKGQSTFYFLAQDILKQFTAKAIANKGVYGVDSTVTENLIMHQLRNEYENKLYTAISTMPLGEERTKYEKLYNGFIRHKANRKGVKTFGTITDSNSTIPDTTLALDEKALKKALKADKSTPEFLYQQLLVMKAYEELDTDAKRLANLVKISQIDTKKFGNNLALQMNFHNSVDTFVEREKTGVYLTNESAPAGIDQGTYAMQQYFDRTFLGKKLRYGTQMPRVILENQSLIATNTYENIYKSIMRTFSGETDVDLQYRKTNDKDFVNEMNGAIESVVRARIAANLPMFDKTPDELYSMITGSNSMCYRLSGLKRYLIENAEKFPFMVNAENSTITNELLNYLQEYPADNETRTIDRIVLANSSMNNDINTEERLISAFDDLLTSDDEFVRDFAHDLAVYAYLTSYDNPGVNSFFKLVPLNWKIQNGYTDSMKQALESFATSNHGGDIVTEGTDNASADLYPSIALTIARNLWRNDQIVPQYKMSDKTDGVIFRANSNRSSVIIHIKGTDKRFIKIGTGENTKLYRKVGTIVVDDLTTEKSISHTTRGVYVLTPKLGTNDNGNKIYEFINSSTKMSMFPQNAMNNDNIISTADLLDIIKQAQDNLVKALTKDYSKDSEGRYRLMYKEVDDTFIEAMTVKQELEMQDPNMFEYSPMDMSMVEPIEDFTGDMQTDMLLNNMGFATLEPAENAQETINIWYSSGENANLSNLANRPFLIASPFTKNSNGLQLNSKSPVAERILKIMNNSNLIGVNKAEPIVSNSVENLFQAVKVLYGDDSYFETVKDDDEFRLSEKGKQLFLKILNTTPKNAKKLGGRYGEVKGLSQAWETDKYEIMYHIMLASFDANPNARRELLSTGSAAFTHKQDTGEWKTQFPKILTNVRSELKTRYKTSDTTLVNNKSTDFSDMAGMLEQALDVSANEAIDEPTDTDDPSSVQFDFTSEEEYPSDEMNHCKK